MCEDDCHHGRLKYAISAEVDAELVRARMECKRLAGLFKECCWYNFETTCRSWNLPWAPSISCSHVELTGYSIQRHQRNGFECEVGYFPVYYEGPLSKAPPLPPEIVLKELKSAHDYMVAVEESVHDAFNWAPGGYKFMKLMKDTMVGKDLSSNICSDCQDDGKDDRSGERDAYGGGYSRQLGDVGSRRVRRRRRRRGRLVEL